MTDEPRPSSYELLEAIRSDQVEMKVNLSAMVTEHSHTKGDVADHETRIRVVETVINRTSWLHRSVAAVISFAVGAGIAIVVTRILAG